MPLPPQGPWDLPLCGYEVLGIGFGFQLDVFLYGEGGATGGLKLAGAFEYALPDESRRSLDVSVQPWEDLTSILSLRHDRIKDARASEDGRLQVEFESSAVLEVGATPMYENWETWGPGFRLIALPGGGAAVVSD